MLETCSPEETAAFLAAGEREADNNRQVLVETGVLLPREAFLARAGWLPDLLERRLREGCAFAIEHRGQRVIPAYLAEAAYYRAGLAQACDVLKGETATSRFIFFCTPKESLAGRTPLQALLDGDLEQVLRTAQGYVAW